MKTCTNSACRKRFSTFFPSFAGYCPHCGKAYPRIRTGIWDLQISEQSKKIPLIKAVRDVTGLGLADSKSLVENAWQGDSWRITKEMLPCGTLAELKEAALRYGICSTKVQPAWKG